MRATRFLGSIFLVAGTTIGAGMLALPVKTGFAGFIPTLAILPLIWLFFLCTAFVLLDVNLSISRETNMISMAEKTLGNLGKVVCWIFYLLLLYALTSAYISGSSPIFLEFFAWTTQLQLPSWIGPLLIVGFFGLFVYHGTRSVDYINRFFMIGLFISYCVIIIFSFKEVDFDLLSHKDSSAVALAIPVLFTSFGFHIIIPTLTTYERHNVKKLRLTLIIGSSIPLFFYILWEFFFLGVVPLTGENSLANTWAMGAPATGAFLTFIKSPFVEVGARLFSFFAIVTSFLGVSLSLRDFLRDALRIKNTRRGRLMACVLTFIPPLFFVFLYPRGFLLALQYAGIFVAILLGILPAAMAWKLSQYKGFFKKCFLSTIISLSIFAIILAIIEQMGKLEYIVTPYL